MTDADRLGFRLNIELRQMMVHRIINTESTVFREHQNGQSGERFGY